NLSAIAPEQMTADERKRRSEIFNRIRVAVDELLLDPSEGGGELAGSDQYSRLFAFEGARRWPGRRPRDIEDKIKPLRELWSTSAAISVGLATQYLKDRSQNFFDRIGGLLSDRRLVGDVLNGLTEIFASIRQQHAAMMFQGSFLRFREAAARR